MDTSKNYLTEKSLGVILKKIFGANKVTPQFKFGAKRYDYKIKSDINTYKNILGEAYNHSYLREKELGLSDEVIEKNLQDSITLIVEFDGPYHYQDNSYAFLEMPGCQWVPLCEELDHINLPPEGDTYILRIPYWLQLNEDITFKFFKVEQDFSKEFPHGFISKNCPLPGTFCTYGEGRFSTEYELLDEWTQEDILKSLIAKCHPKGKFSRRLFYGCASPELWLLMFDSEHPLREDFISPFYSYLIGKNPDFELKEFETDIQHNLPEGYTMCGEFVSELVFAMHKLCECGGTFGY